MMRMSIQVKRDHGLCDPIGPFRAIVSMALGGLFGAFHLLQGWGSKAQSLRQVHGSL